ncbi:MAG: hypothetical protein FWC03_04470 [Treponema sp.]|nr:hypothetical protein [Treponema sp.]
MRYSEEEKIKRLEDWKQSGKSAWAYAKDSGINQQTFFNWTKAVDETKHNFVEIPAVSTANAAVVKPSMGIPEILIEKGDMKIYIPLVINHNQLRAVMEGFGASL